VFVPATVIVFDVYSVFNSLFVTSVKIKASGVESDQAATEKSENLSVLKVHIQDETVHITKKS